MPTLDDDEIDDDVFADYAGVAEISIKEALEGDAHEEWEEAILSEIKSLIKNDTWTIKRKGDCKNVVGCRYVLTHKQDPEGLFDKKKARLVAKGYSQRFGIDYSQTFAPVARLESIRLMAALSAELSMEIHQLDITTAYLNGELDEEIFMELPKFLEKWLRRIIHQEEEPNVVVKAKEMLESLETGGDVCSLKKALYGLKQAGRQWNNKLSRELKNLRLSQTIGEPCVYHVERECSSILVLIYVDDILIASQNRTWIEEIKHALGEIFDMKNFGLARYCLGIEISQSPNQITLSQREYIDNLLRRFNMAECHGVSMPMEVGMKLVDDVNNEEDEVQSKPSWPYRELIGALMYLIVATRPDIANAVTKLAQFCNSPRKIHWQAGKRVLRYLRASSDVKIAYRRTGENIVGYSDSDCGGCVVDRRSFSVYVYLLGGGAISWRSQKQKTPALSSTEAEDVSLSEAVKEAIYLRSLLSELKCEQFASVTLFVDNQGAICLAINPVFHARAKHIDIKFHFIRSAIVKEKINVKYISTNEMIADELTKALPITKLKKCMFGTGQRQVQE